MVFSVFYVNKDENVHRYAVRWEKDKERERKRERVREIEKTKKCDMQRERYAVRGEEREITGFCEKITNLTFCQNITNLA